VEGGTRVKSVHLICLVALTRPSGLDARTTDTRRDLDRFVGSVRWIGTGPTRRTDPPHQSRCNAIHANRLVEVMLATSTSKALRFARLVWRTALTPPTLSAAVGNTVCPALRLHSCKGFCCSRSRPFPVLLLLSPAMFGLTAGLRLRLRLRLRVRVPLPPHPSDLLVPRPPEPVELLKCR
jgi:hypothetical protein